MPQRKVVLQPPNEALRKDNYAKQKSPVNLKMITLLMTTTPMMSFTCFPTTRKMLRKMLSASTVLVYFPMTTREKTGLDDPPAASGLMWHVLILD
ncbi:hypothetical protein PR048_022344 [Dryococelus australis]|uniref:Uncharacterized protein n=1 Tax=Dryococelus australis TaxID=614101 RepID=A0ABQ9H0V2_9NEOP|nr:hypothetical protein PR048_022344 [Dryococelus australis]